MASALIYVRVSTEEQVENTSLATQEEAARRFCAARGYQVCRVFRDEGVSAKTTDRLELRRMLEYCRRHGKANQVEAVVVYSTSRLARDSYGYHLICTLLKKQGIRLWSVTEPFEDDAVGNLVRGVLASIAQFDNELKSERTRVAMRAGAAAGRWQWVAPYGYRSKVSESFGNSLEIDETKSEIVRTLFEKAAGGIETHAQIAAWFRPRCEAPKSAVAKIRVILRNPVYKGRLVNATWGLDVPGDWVPLVSPEVWARAQGVLKLRPELTKPKRLAHEDFPLRGILIDGGSGKPYGASWSRGKKGTRYGYYHVGKARVGRDIVHEAFVALLRRLKPSAPVFRLWKRVVLEERGEELERMRADGERLKRRLDEVQGRKKKLLATYLDNKVDEGTYDQVRAELDEQATLIEAEMAETRVDELELEGYLAYAERLLLHLDRVWLEAKVDDQQRLQRCLFPKGLVWDADHGGFRTPVSLTVFDDLQAIAEGKGRMVPHPAVSSNTLRDLRAIAGLKIAA